MKVAFSASDCITFSSENTHNSFFMLILLELTTETLLQIALKNVLPTASLAHTSQQEKPLPIGGSARKIPWCFGDQNFL